MRVGIRVRGVFALAIATTIVSVGCSSSNPFDDCVAGQQGSVSLGGQCCLYSTRFGAPGPTVAIPAVSGPDDGVFDGGVSVAPRAGDERLVVLGPEPAEAMGADDPADFDTEADGVEDGALSTQALRRGRATRPSRPAWGGRTGGVYDRWSPWYWNNPYWGSVAFYGYWRTGYVPVTHWALINRTWVWNGPPGTLYACPTGYAFVEAGRVAQ